MTKPEAQSDDTHFSLRRRWMEYNKRVHPLSFFFQKNKIIKKREKHVTQTGETAHGGESKRTKFGSHPCARLFSSIFSLSRCQKGVANGPTKTGGRWIRSFIIHQERKGVRGKCREEVLDIPPPVLLPPHHHLIRRFFSF